MAIKYIGMDFEATGSNPWGNHAPIELGLAVSNPITGNLPSVWQELIGKWDWKEWEWNEEAAQVHHIPQSEIDAAQPVWQADIRAANWILEQGVASNRMFNIFVGYNVAGYDRQFITRHFPNLDRIFSYRTYDLNVPTFVLAGNSEKAYGAVKKDTKDYAKMQIDNRLREVGKHQEGIGEIAFDWHRGGYDAVAALYSKEYLENRIAGLFYSVEDDQWVTHVG